MPPTVEETINLLVASIQQNRLVVFCGAGISMAHPSFVPIASALKAQCLSKYQQLALPAIPIHFKHDLESLTEYLFSQAYQDVFVRTVVDWRPFRRNSNVTHRAIADLLVTGAARFSVTTNFDELIELSAMQLGEDSFLASLDAISANIPREHAPFIKLHGCARDPDSTVWCKYQLQGAPPVSPANQEIRNRVLSLTGWLAANLFEKTVLMVGFWTDWAYLGDVLVNAVKAVHSPMVVLVDPASDVDLQQKAPALWRWANTSARFIHIEQKAEEFLPVLRDAFSRNLLSRVLNDAIPGFQAQTQDANVPPSDFDTVSSEDLFSLRQDTFGVPANRIPRFAKPDGSMDAVGRAHLLLRKAGANLDGPSYRIQDGRKVRVINGRTKQLSQAKSEFIEKSLPLGGIDDDFVVCAGASEDGGVPSNIMGSSGASTVVRPVSTAEWVTLDQAISRNLV